MGSNSRKTESAEGDDGEAVGGGMTLMVSTQERLKDHMNQTERNRPRITRVIDTRPPEGVSGAHVGVPANAAAFVSRHVRF